MPDGIDTTNGRFIKGIIPWNKGKIGVYTDEVRKSMGEQNIGKSPYPELPTPRACKDCGRILDRDKFARPKSGKICKECASQKRSDWGKQNPDRVRASRRKHQSTAVFRLTQSRWACENRQRKRMIVLRHYSPNLTCQRCEFRDVRALTVDHIDGGGCKHRKEVTGRPHGSLDFYKWIIKNNFPPMFQILCSNCQSIKRWENKEGVKIDFKER